MTVFSCYQDWRETVPWTDAQILAALREIEAQMPSEFLASRSRLWADYFEKTGRLSSRMLGVALPVLVKLCAVCGKMAWYRLGNSGRCRAHKYVKDPFVERKAQRLRLAHAIINRQTLDRERVVLGAQAHHKATGRRKSTKR